MCKVPSDAIKLIAFFTAEEVDTSEKLEALRRGHFGLSGRGQTTTELEASGLFGHPKGRVQVTWTVKYGGTA